MNEEDNEGEKIESLGVLNIRRGGEVDENEDHIRRVWIASITRGVSPDELRLRERVDSHVTGTIYVYSSVKLKDNILLGRRGLINNGHVQLGIGYEDLNFELFRIGYLGEFVPEEVEDILIEPFLIEPFVKCIKLGERARNMKEADYHRRDFAYGLEGTSE